MGFGKLLRSTQYVATDTVTGATETFTIVDNVAPDWATAGYRGGMALPGAWRAANLLADLIGQIPWHAYRNYGDSPESLIQPTPPLLEQPAPPETRMTTFSSWALDYLWEGNAIGIYTARNAQGWPTAVVPVPARLVGVRRITDTEYSSLPVGALEYSIGSLRFGANDILHIKGPCEPGDLRGWGVLECHLNTISLAAEQNRQARSISKSGVPTGVLVTTSQNTTQENMKAAKEGWLKAQRDRTVAALGPNTDFKPISWNPEEMQMIEARKFSLTELELIFGMPVGFLGGQSSSRTYSNIEQDAVNLIKFSLGGHIARFEQALSLAFPRGTAVRANLDAILRSDTLTRYQAHKLGIEAGFLTKDEAREMEHRPPLPVEPATLPPSDPTSNPTEETEQSA